jgi:tRNA (guanine-N7-)-methyltransferase
MRINMRMRKKKNLTDRMERVSEFLIEAPASMQGKWRELSGSRPVQLEIGCGKGKFVCDTASEYTDLFLVALEKIPDVLVMAMEKADKACLENVRFIRGDAGLLGNYFAQGEVERIYLNFSDPWPANRHKTRRLTSEGYLKIYKGLLAKGGSVFFKTDNRDLFEFSVKEFVRCGWTLKNVTRDLHDSAADKEAGRSPAVPSSAAAVQGPGGAVTEYEQRFVSMGMPINRLEAYPEF